MAQGLRRRLQRWVRPRQPEALPVRIDRRRIYVLPTRFGLFFGGLVAVMALGALNFNNNPALLLALVLAGTAQASLIAAHMQLSGLELQSISGEAVPAGKPMPLRVALGAGDGRSRQGLLLGTGASEAAAHLHDGSAVIELSIPTERRGLLRLPRLEISTVQPLGLARAWSYAWPDQALLVYPAPEIQAPPLPPLAGERGRPRVERAGDEVHHVRGYHPGDAPRTIAWKASARRDSLLVREYEQPTAAEVSLEWQATAGLPYEQRIRRLARWVDDAERENRRYRLVLPQQPPLPAGNGMAHRHACLRALALLPIEAGA